MTVSKVNTSTVRCCVHYTYKLLIISVFEFLLAVGSLTGVCVVIDHDSGRTGQYAKSVIGYAISIIHSIVTIAMSIHVYMYVRSLMPLFDRSGKKSERQIADKMTQLHTIANQYLYTSQLLGIISLIALFVTLSVNLTEWSDNAREYSMYSVGFKTTIVVTSSVVLIIAVICMYTVQLLCSVINVDTDTAGVNLQVPNQRVRWMLVLSVTCILLISLSIALLAITEDASYIHYYGGMALFVDLCAMYTFACGIVGTMMYISVAFVRVSIARIVPLYDTFIAAGIMFTLAMGSAAIWITVVSDADTGFSAAAITAVYCYVASAVLIIQLIAVHQASRPPRSGLHAETVDLNQWTPAQRQYLIQMLSDKKLASNNTADSLNGQMIVEMMLAYQNTEFPTDQSCVILRLYHESSHSASTHNYSAELENRWKSIANAVDEDLADFLIARQQSDRMQAIKMKQQQQLQSQTQSDPNQLSINIPIDTEPQSESQSNGNETDPTVMAALSGTLDINKLAKTQRNKLRKKLRRKQIADDIIDAIFENRYKPADNGNVKRQSSAHNTSETLSAEFLDMMSHTEAFVVICQKRQYDLTLALQGWFGTCIQKMFGVNGILPILVVQCAWIGLQWPIRSGLIMLRHSRRNVTRTAACLKAVTEWNHSLPTAQQSTLMFVTCYRGDDTYRAINSSGYMKMRLPDTHILDLRPYIYNMNTPPESKLHEYMKQIKYQDQSHAFKRAGGIVEVLSEWSDELCRDLYYYWQQVNTKRQRQGYPEPLIAPSLSLIYALRQHLSPQYRTCILLRDAEHRIVSCCINFRSPGTVITTDLQGMNYTLSHQYKAYFVMMQEVVREGLIGQYRMVDMGPTTPAAKTSIGCSSVQMYSATYSTSIILKLAIMLTGHKFAEDFGKSTPSQKQGNKHDNSVDTELDDKQTDGKLSTIESTKKLTGTPENQSRARPLEITVE